VIVPRFEPMLATSWPRAFDDPGWWFEPKWDGIRGIVSWDGVSLSIRTRRGNEVAVRYPELTVPLGRPCVLDGEIVSLDETGRPSFQLLQNRMSAAPPAAGVSFVGSVLVGFGFEERVQRLSSLELPEAYRASEPVRGDGLALWHAVVERDLEGIVAKRSGSPYRSGTRSADWRKVHHTHTAKAVVGGFTPGEGGRSGGFGALVLGQWDGPRLRWVGNVGTGFDHEAVAAIRRALDAMVRDTSPFRRDGEMPPARWVEPSLVAAVGYRNWTEAGRLRFPVFKGFADDDPAAVTWARSRRLPTRRRRSR
jgi:bifunctional non-homologous end joining protein LigD